MAQPPRYPDGHNDPASRPGPVLSRRSARWQAMVAIVVGISIVALMVFLHLSGAMGTGSH